MLTFGDGCGIITKLSHESEENKRKNGCGSGPEGIQRHGNGAFGFQFLNGSSEIKNKKSSKKLLTNAKQCDIIIKSLNERVR